MLKGKTEKKRSVKKKDKENNQNQPKLTCQTRDSSHETRITQQKKKTKIIMKSNSKSNSVQR